MLLVAVLTGDDGEQSQPKAKGFSPGLVAQSGGWRGEICSWGSRVRAESRSRWQRESREAGELTWELP